DRLPPRGEATRRRTAGAFPHHPHGAEAHRRARRRLTLLGHEGFGAMPAAAARSAPLHRRRGDIALPARPRSEGGAHRVATAPCLSRVALSRSQGCAPRPAGRVRGRHAAADAAAGSRRTRLALTLLRGRRKHYSPPRSTARFPSSQTSTRLTTPVTVRDMCAI